MVSISFVSTDNDKDDGEASLQQSFYHRPTSDTNDAGIGKLLRDDTHCRYGKQGKQNGYYERNDGTSVTRNLETHHQHDEQ